MIEKYVRLAVPDDVPTVLKFARDFYKASPYRSLPFDAGKGRTFLERVIYGSLQDHVCLVALKDGEAIGFLVGAAAEPVFSSSKIATELGWWIDERHRNSRASVLIYEAYEDWAVRIGCSHVQGAYLPNVSPDLEKFYKKRGYKQVESSFIKVLKI